MTPLLRWLAAREIEAARVAGFRDGMAVCVRMLRNAAAREGDGRERERDVLLAVAEGVNDAVELTAR